MQINYNKREYLNYASEKKLNIYNQEGHYTYNL